MEFTEEGKEVLTMLLKMMHVIEETSDGYFELSDGTTFGRTDLFNLAKKLDVDY